jgi:hypothetical protein
LIIIDQLEGQAKHLKKLAAGLANYSVRLNQ